MKKYSNFQFNDIRIFPEKAISEKKQSGEGTRKDIAIIGAAGLFPEADTLEEYWNNIFLGRDCIKEIPLSRKEDYQNLKDIHMTERRTQEHSEFAESGYLDYIDCFDYEYFLMSLKEAKLMDPNQRLFLQCCFNAIWDAGYQTESLKGTNTGIFLGYSADFGLEYKNILNQKVIDMARTGNIRSIIASRTAYLLDLHGPCAAIDTACSSSLVAVHQACQSIRNKECDMALAGGINLQIQPVETKDTGIGILSSGYRARAFDQNANGTGTGEGAGIIILKELTKAIQDGNQIYAVIKGSAVNQDGLSNGITAPNSKAQEELILRAWRNAGVDPESITLIEAHGTATKLGDSIEIDGIKRAFSAYTRKRQFCAIGSVKTNIGHLDNAAGIAGLLKCIYALRNKTLPPTIHFTQPNHKINFLDSPVYVNDKSMPWERKEYPRRCGVNSFGLSGTNCHVVLEEYTENNKTKEIDGQGPLILVISGKDEATLKHLVKAYNRYLSIQDDVQLEQFCFTVNTGRDLYKERLAVTFNNKKELMKKLFFIEKKGNEAHNGEDIFFGSITAKIEESPQLLIQYKERNQWNENSLRQLASYYVKGAKIPWKEIYASRNLISLSLPAYPFKKKRCWIESGDSINGFKPLVDRLLIQTKDMTVYETVLQNNRFWVLKEHEIFDSCVLPGTAYLEMVYSILKRNLSQEKELVFEGFTFLVPIQLKGNDKKIIHIIMKHKKHTYDIEIVSYDQIAGDWIVHCKGSVSAKDLSAGNQRDIKKYMDQMNQPFFTKTQEKYADEFIHTGPHWNCMKGTCADEKYVAGLFELPAQYTHEVSSYSLHPSLLDCAVNIPIRQIKNGMFLPFSYGKFTIKKNVPGSFWSIINISQNEIENLRETVTYDLELVDQYGNVFAEIEKYTLKRVNTDENGMQDMNEPLFHQMVWEQKPLNRKVPLEKDSLLTVLFLGADEMSKALKDALTRASDSCINVTYGESCKKINEHHYTLNQVQKDYDKLFHELLPDRPLRIIHALSLDNVKNVLAKEIEKDVTDSILSLFYLTKALAQSNRKEKIEIVLLSQYGYFITKEEPFIYPYANSLYEMSKVVQNEYGNIQCRSIDFLDDTDIDVIAHEITNETEDRITAYRNRERFVQKLTAMEESQFKQRSVTLSKQGCYLFTGGTGGLALTIALHMSKQKPLHFVLISRTGSLKDHGNIIDEIKQNGSTVTIIKADVSKKNELKDALVKARKQFTKINGIIHAAGIPGEKFIFRKEKQQFMEVIQPKITGSIYLMELVEEPLDFFVFFSSTSVVEGSPGQGDYAAANAFMDAFVYCLKENQNGISINWAPWKEVGMAFNNEVDQKNTDFVFLHPSEGTMALDKVMTSTEKHIVVGRFNQKTEHKTGKKSFEKRESFDSTKQVSLFEMKSAIKQVWINLLEVESIEFDDTFTSKGGNSIFAVYLLNELELYFPGKLNISDIFTYPTINQIADYLYSQTMEHPPEKADTFLDDEMDQMLNRLAKGELDVEEIEYLLEED